MADSSSSPATLDSNPQAAEPENPNSQANKPESAASSFPPPQSLPPTSLSVGINPTLHPPLVSTPQPPPSLSYAPSPLSGAVAVPPTAPSFRPVPLSAHHFSPMPGTGMLNPSYPNPGVQPPGVSSVAAPAPGMASGGTGAVPLPVPQPMMAYQVPPGQVPNPAMRPYATMPNGFAAVPTATPQGAFPLAGIPRFPSPYPAMIRTPFPPRPPGAMGMVPAMPRPPIPGIPGVRPIIPPVVRPAVLPSVTPAEQPQTTIYIGRIAQSVDNDFMLSLLQLCGPVKSWKRAQNPSDGTPRTFGFCEFESAEGVLRALRLLTKLNIDGQELVLKGTQATRDYLKRYVEKKAENSKKLKETQVSETKEEEAATTNVARNETSKPSAEDSKEDNDSGEKDLDIARSAVLSDEDRDADRVASEKLTNALEERLKSRPLPPPPLMTTADVSGNSSAEPFAKLKDGEADTDVLKPDAADDRNDDDTTSDHKQTSEQDKPETSSPDRSRRYDRRSRERDRERDLKRDKEREIERYERETERERARKEREQRRKFEEAERQYEECLKEWEYREREREKQRQYEKEREKEKERKRKKEILYDEDDEDDDSRRKWRRGALEEKRKKRSREKEDDSVDRQKEEEEIAEAKRKAEEEQLQKQKDPLKLVSGQMSNVNEKTILAEESANEIKVMASERESELDSSCDNHIGDGILQNGSGDELSTIPSETRHSGGLPAKRLGFGLVGSGKRTAVPSVFHEEEDDEAQKEKKMRPLVPIDYSAEELQAVQPASTGALPPNLAAAAEFAKRISNVNSKEEKSDGERERGRRSGEKSGHRDRNDEDTYRSKDENKTIDRDRERDHVLDKVKTPDNKKLLDAKQLIDMIPKTKEELFSYDINWAIYEKHALHERMRPWISKKITEFLGEAHNIVSSSSCCPQERISVSASMASICHSISVPSLSKPTRITSLRPLHAFLPNSTSVLSIRSCKTQATSSKSSTTVGDAREPNDGSMSIDNLHRFFDLNSGKWNGSFFQFDIRGNLLHEISTKLAVSSYGEDELISLIQTLYIRQKSSVSLPGNDDEPEWAEYKIKETNMFTVDKYQQIGFFPNEKAFSLRYQTAGMLETVLRQGVLGEDDTGEEFPKNLKLPSRRPSIVCENCLYIPDRDLRARAFHIMDPQGIIEMLLIFLEERDDGKLFSHPLNSNLVSGQENRLLSFLGDWKGHSRTKRSGVYGATIAEAVTISSLQMDDNGQIIQDITTTSMNGDVTTNVHWAGTKLDNLVTFDGGYQITLLPGGMYMGCPCDVAKSVADNKSFHLEFCWLEAPGKRQRLVRTYDVEGLAVSSTYFSEIKL